MKGIMAGSSGTQETPNKTALKVHFKHNKQAKHCLFVQAKMETTNFRVVQNCNKTNSRSKSIPDMLKTEYATELKQNCPWRARLCSRLDLSLVVGAAGLA